MTPKKGIQMKETLEILEKVNAFYSASFDQLLIIVFGVIGFVGVILPLFITYYQSRQINIEKNALENYMKNLMSIELGKEKEILNTALEENKLELSKALEKNKEELKEQIQSARGGAFLIQANAEYDKGNFNSSIKSCIFAISSFIKANDENNLQRTLENLVEKNLPFSDKNIINEIPGIEEKCNLICEKLSSLNENGRYTGEIERLKSAIKRTLEREPEE